MATKWADISQRGRVRRKAYARLLLRCVLGGDFRSVPFLIRRITLGGPRAR